MDFLRPHIKGWVGEVKSQLSQKIFLDSKVYTSFNNFIVQDESGSTQIDHIMVAKYGVFVVETKDWSGWIFGNERDEKWTQNIFGVKTRFQNPLRQNHRHRMSLSKYLDIGSEKIIPIIMVWGSCEFKTKMPGNVILGGYTGCTDYIFRIFGYHPILFIFLPSFILIQWLLLILVACPTEVKRALATAFI